jgi:hypothetical protein
MENEQNADDVRVDWILVAILAAMILVTAVALSLAIRVVG